MKLVTVLTTFAALQVCYLETSANFFTPPGMLFVHAHRNIPLASGPSHPQWLIIPSNLRFLGPLSWPIIPPFLHIVPGGKLEGHDGRNVMHHIPEIAFARCLIAFVCSQEVLHTRTYFYVGGRYVNVSTVSHVCAQSPGHPPLHIGSIPSLAPPH